MQEQAAGGNQNPLFDFAVENRAYRAAAHSGHILTLDREHEAVFKEIADFFAE